jgi:AraC-like DNA-binding protein
MKKLLFQDLPFENDRHFNVYKEDLPYFVVPWHYHPSIEIMYVESGTGTRLVGDHMEGYNEGDVCMIGPSLPHEWRSNRCDGERSTCYCLFFRKELFEGDFIRLPEMSSIRELLEKSVRGLKFFGSARDKMKELIPRIYSEEGVQRILLLFQLLAIMSQTSDVEMLSGQDFTDEVDSDDFDRFNKVYRYIHDNFHKSLRLDDVAAIASMSSGAFCRYFKSRTKKTFLQYLNDLRIAHAKKLIVENTECMSAIGTMVGFDSQSAFFSKFKQITGLTPLKYRKMYIRE